MNSSKKTSAFPLVEDRRGLSTVEYAILLILIVVGALTAWKQLGTHLKEQLEEGEDRFESNVKVGS